MRIALLLAVMPIWHCAVMMKFFRLPTARPLRHQSSVAARLCHGAQLSRNGNTTSSSSGNPSSRGAPQRTLLEAAGAGAQGEISD